MAASGFASGLHHAPRGAAGTRGTQSRPRCPWAPVPRTWFCGGGQRVLPQSSQCGILAWEQGALWSATNVSIASRLSVNDCKRLWCSDSTAQRSSWPRCLQPADGSDKRLRLYWSGNSDCVWISAGNVSLALRWNEHVIHERLFFEAGTSPLLIYLPKWEITSNQRRFVWIRIFFC